jgi:hypothetical protein
VSNLLAGFSAAQSFLDRTKHCAEAQLEAAEFSSGASLTDVKAEIAFRYVGIY